MKSVLLFLAVILAPAIASAGYPFYYHYQPYYEPQFFVVHNVIPAAVPHQNFIEDKNGKVQQTVKTEIFAPVYLQRTEVIDYSHPNYVRKDVFVQPFNKRGH